MKIKNLFSYSILGVVLIISVVLLLSYTRGDLKNGKLQYQSGINTKSGGPFELSNTTGRYVLTEAIVNRGTLFLTEDEAKASAPDVVSFKGHYFSIFTPGISFLGVPLYFLGKILGYPQLSTFMLNVIFALGNIFLIYFIARKLGADRIPAVIGGFTFAFATNALGYMLSFTQHHVSTFFILCALLVVSGKPKFWKNLLFGALFGAGLFADIPNAFLMAPLLIFLFCRQFTLTHVKEKIIAKVNLSGIFLAFGLLPFLFAFGWYNFTTAGKATLLAQNIGRTAVISREYEKAQEIRRSQVKHEVGDAVISTPFQTRSSLNGLYILLISNERSWLFYSPVVLIGLVGLYFAYKSAKHSVFAVLAISVVAVNIVLYSMFGDPWGGWAFGPRYLIPAASLMSGAVAVFITKFRKNYFLIASFGVLFVYSVFVSSLGAITTNSIPPKVEAINFNPPIAYTYERNLNMADRGESASLLYNALLKNNLTVMQFLILLTVASSLVGLAPIALYVINQRRKNES